ncbi:MAG: DUF262 domain-containing protein [Lachnospiraceae bacterium]|jgi:hypothetical protein|nr:DUF262 domain-containing protein [Lachnospiraceae bacterium]
MAIIQENDDLEIEIEKKKAEYAGVEYEAEGIGEESGEEAEQPFDAEKIRVDQQMLSIKYMLELMEQNLIELNPGYQRRRVWKDNKRKSLLIESLMLRIPIPAFYFYENEDGKYQVIDGQQRLTTIKEFVNGEFRLTGLEYLGSDYNKKKFEDLDTKYIQRIYRTQIAVNILDARSPKNVIYDIFRRVNTGGMNLNPQEMRNAICKQEVRDFLVKSTCNHNYLSATRGRVCDDRMDSQELVLRFYAFYKAYDYEKNILHYDYSNIATMLDDAIENLNKMKPENREVLFQKFDLAMRRSWEAFGKYAFSKIYCDGSTVNRNMDYINKSLFSSFSVLLMDSKYDDIDIEAQQKKILQTLANALKNHHYVNSITVGTGDRRNVYANFEYSRKVLEECLG